jgi:O-antigen/teichoic acid export membrane protein
MRDFVRSGSSFAVAITIANVATYGFTVIAARLLGPRQYGAVAALLAALLVVGVLALGIQATAARRVSAEPTDLAEIEHEILRV